MTTFRDIMGSAYGPVIKIDLGLHGDHSTPKDTMTENKRQYDGIYQAQKGMRFWGLDASGCDVGIGSPKRYSFQYDSTDHTGTDWYRVRHGDLDRVVKVNPELLPGKSTCYVDKVGDLTEPVEDPHRHDGRYRVNGGYAFYGTSDQGDRISLKENAILTFMYVSTHDGHDWYHVESEDVFCTMWVPQSSFPGRTDYFTRLGDVPVDAPEPKWQEDATYATRFDGTYRVKPGYTFSWNGKNPLGGFCGVTAKPEEIFTFRYCSTEPGSKHIFEVQVRDQMVQGEYVGVIDNLTNYTLSPAHVAKMSDSIVLEEEMPTAPVDNRSRHDGLYQVKPGGRFEWCGTGTKNTVRVAPGEYFTFRHEQNDHYEVRTADHQVIGSYGNLDTITDASLYGWLRPTNVEKISTSTAWVDGEPCGRTWEATPDAKAPGKKDPAQHDGTYRAGPDGFQWLGHENAVHVAPDERFTFQFVEKNRVVSGSNDYRVTTATATTIGPARLDENGLSTRVTKITSAILPLDEAPVMMPDGLVLASRSLRDRGIAYVCAKDSTQIVAKCFKNHGRHDDFTLVIRPDGSHECPVCGVRGTRLADLVAAIDAYQTQEKTAFQFAPSATRHNGTYRVKPGCTFKWCNRDGVVVLRMNAGETFTVELLDCCAELGYKYHVNGSGIDCRDTVWRDNAGPYLKCAEKISDLTEPFGAKTVPPAPKKEDTLDTTYKSVANASAMLKTLQSLLMFDVVTSDTSTLRAQCFRGCKDPRAGTLRIDVPSGQYRCTVCGVQGPDVENLVYTIKAHRANNSADSAQKDSIMNTSNVKQAFNLTNHKALAAVKTGAEQAGAHVAHEIVIQQVEKLLGARFPAEFYATEIGRAVISMGSAYALLLTTQVVQHPLAAKANHVAELAMVAATYESAGPLLAKAREFVEGTVVAAMGAGVDLGDK